MNYIKIFITIALLIPSITYGAFSVGWNATSTTQGWISPNRVNGVDQVVRATYFTATTTTATSTFPNLSILTNIFRSGITDGCASWSSGYLTSLEVACGSGGGSSGGTWSTTTSQVSGRLINHPNNATDVVVIGSNATTTAEWWYDPTALVGFFSGKLGIGTTSPYATLSVVGEAVARNFTATSSTASTFPYASTTALTVSGGLYNTSLTSALILTGADGLMAEYTGIDCTNQFVRDVSALGAGTCATVSATDVDLADLTATNGTLTFSGTYDGQTARTVGLNLASANTWTALQQFSNSSSTLASFGYASSTQWIGGGLSADCDGDTQTLGWDATLSQFTCGDDDNSGGGSFPFSADTNYGQVVYSTSTPTLWLKSGLFASSTSQIQYASTTAISSDATFSTKVYAGAGSASLPSYTFSTDSGGDSGIFRTTDIGFDVIGFTTEGVERLRIGQTTGIRPSVDITTASSYYLENSAGTVSAPNYTFASDTNTGIWKQYADSLNFTVGGTESFRQDVASTSFPVGNLGIGTTSPYAKLSVVGEIVGAYFTGTTTATSTFAGSIAVTEVNATSTYAGGIDISDGCFAIDGACIGTGAGSGDITSVGDVSSGAAFDGTQGTTLTFNNAGGDKTLAFDGSNFTFNDDLIVTTLDTGQGANELYDMDQNVLTTSDPTFNSLTLTTDLTVDNGGIGVSTLTDGGVLLGSGTDAITAMAVLADGSIIVGDGTTDPVALAAFESSTGDLAVTAGGTGVGTLTGLLQGNGTSDFTAVTGTAGQFPYFNGTNTLLASSTIFLATTGKVGIGTTTPHTMLTVASGSIYNEMIVVATTSTTNINFASSTQQFIQMGVGNITLNLMNGRPGLAVDVKVCNPSATSGTVTWTGDGNGVSSSNGLTPSHTTTANTCTWYKWENSYATSTTGIAPFPTQYDLKGQLSGFQ